jgi:hypothetical protein
MQSIRRWYLTPGVFWSFETAMITKYKLFEDFS